MSVSDDVMRYIFITGHKKKKGEEERGVVFPPKGEVSRVSGCPGVH